MKTITTFGCAITAVIASAILHWILFRPDLPTLDSPVPIPPIPVLEESAQPPNKLPEVDRTEPIGAQPAREPTRTSDGPRAPTTEATDQDGERAASRSKPDSKPEFVLDYRVDDPEALLALAVQLDLHFVLMARPTPTQPTRTWPIAIDSSRGVMRRTIPAPHADRFLELPLRSASGPLRYEGWTRAATALHELPPNLSVKLALAIPNDRLDQAGRAAVATTCAERGIDPASIVRAVLRPAGAAAGARLVVDELVTADGGTR